MEHLCKWWWWWWPGLFEKCFKLLIVCNASNSLWSDSLWCVMLCEQCLTLHSWFMISTILAISTLVQNIVNLPLFISLPLSTLTPLTSILAKHHVPLVLVGVGHIIWCTCFEKKTRTKFNFNDVERESHGVCWLLLVAMHNSYSTLDALYLSLSLCKEKVYYYLKDFERRESVYMCVACDLCGCRRRESAVGLQMPVWGGWHGSVTLVRVVWQWTPVPNLVLPGGASLSRHRA